MERRSAGGARPRARSRPGATSPGSAPTSGPSHAVRRTGTCASWSTTSSPATSGPPSSGPGQTIEEVGDRLDGDVLGADPLAAYDGVGRRSPPRRSGAPGAMDAPCAVSYGPVPGRGVLRAPAHRRAHPRLGRRRPRPVRTPRSIADSSRRAGWSWSPSPTSSSAPAPSAPITRFRGRRKPAAGRSDARLTVAHGCLGRRLRAAHAR